MLIAIIRSVLSDTFSLVGVLILVYTRLDKWGIGAFLGCLVLAMLLTPPQFGDDEEEEESKKPVTSALPWYTRTTRVFFPGDHDYNLPDTIVGVAFTGALFYMLYLAYMVRVAPMSEAILMETIKQELALVLGVWVFIDLYERCKFAFWERHLQRNKEKAA